MARDEYVKRFVHPDDAAALRRRIEENQGPSRSNCYLSNMNTGPSVGMGR